jgi:radical SAM superfamily enzyme YgiQ (UPF0313 family)
MQIKILFVNAIDILKEIEIRYPPLGIGYLVSSLRKHFGEDTIEFKIIDSNIEYEIINFEPDIVGISSVSQNYNKAINYAEIAQKHGAFVLCGGVHISMLPSSLTKDMDIGVIGEGEETICELFEIFFREQRFPIDSLKEIKGIIYWDDNNQLIFTNKRNLISPLDKLSFPSRDMFDIKTNIYMFSSRGCPYRCTFCASSRFWNKPRFFSAKYVVDEIMYLIKKYNVNNINFYDDLFAFDVERIKQIIFLLREKGLLGKVSFSGSIRANLVNDGIIELLKEMGVENLGMGLESGCTETLKYLKGDNISIEDSENAINIIRKYNIKLHCSFIIGSPNEQKEDVLATLKFIKKNQLSSFDLYVLTPFPGTPIWNYAKSQGLVHEKMDWDKLNVNFEGNYRSTIILSKKLTREVIYKLFQRFKKYQKQKEIYELFKKGIQHPLKVFKFLIKEINRYWS